ncbi:MAG: hypothetical protein IPM21_07025 [Acidobacteria bacterium]|nr:hypothetical protein [Acidobacteriota bacterium]
MTPTEKLKLLAAWDTEPALTETEIDDLLAEAAIADSDGLAPEDEEWTPTYNINKAAASAWLIKAGRASALTEIDPPESGIVTSKIFENCVRMARVFQARSAVSLRTGLSLGQL